MPKGKLRKDRKKPTKKLTKRDITNIEQSMFIFEEKHASKSLDELENMLKVGYYDKNGEIKKPSASQRIVINKLINQVKKT
jgi:hypothetical protein